MQHCGNEKDCGAFFYMDVKPGLRGGKGLRILKCAYGEDWAEILNTVKGIIALLGTSPEEEEKLDRTCKKKRILITVFDDSVERKGERKEARDEC